MKASAFLLGLCLVLSSATAFAGATYSESLAAADTALGAQNTEGALKELDAALNQAGNEGERALALAKKGYVLAFLKKDYAGGRAAAEEALKVSGLAPVAKVTALQVLAECQMKAEKNYASAATNLLAGLALEGVEWAKPALTMSLADCYRSIGQLEPALTYYRSVAGMANAGDDLKAGAHLNIGFIFQYDRKDAAQARAAYGEAVKLRPALKTEVEGHLAKFKTSP